MMSAQPTQYPPMGQATIKTDGGFQTVPVILQHGNNNPMGNIQIQKQIGAMGQQIIQPVVSFDEKEMKQNTINSSNNSNLL